MALAGDSGYHVGVDGRDTHVPKGDDCASPHTRVFVGAHALPDALDASARLTCGHDQCAVAHDAAQGFNSAGDQDARAHGRESAIERRERFCSIHAHPDARVAAAQLSMPSAAAERRRADL